MSERVTQAEFARRTGRSKAAVTKYKKAGILDDTCFETAPDGRVLVIYDVALARLQERLDPVQSVANGKPVAVLPTDLLPRSGVLAPGARTGGDALIEERIRALKLQNAEKLEQRRLKEGTYCRSAEVAAVFAESLGQVVSLVESELPALAEDLAQRHGSSAREELFCLKDWFRGARDRISRIAAAMQERLPELETDGISDGNEHSPAEPPPPGGGGGGPGSEAPPDSGL